jgi:nucleoid-associated protein YgaU
MNNILLEIKMKNNTRNTLLITVATAALMAGSGLISAQDMKGNREAPAAADQKAPVGKTDQHPASVPQKSSPPTAQAPLKEKTAPTAQAPVKEKTAPTAQAPAKEKTAPTAQAPLKEKLAPSVGKDETKSGAPAALSAEQHAKIWSTLRGEKAERLSNVHFSTTVGGVIPATVHLYRLPVSIVEYVPQYRDYEYILVGDEILIVDPRTLRIVAVIAA